MLELLRTSNPSFDTRTRPTMIVADYILQDLNEAAIRWVRKSLPPLVENHIGSNSVGEEISPTSREPHCVGFEHRAAEQHSTAQW
jgi:hypothetical protein